MGQGSLKFCSEHLLGKYSKKKKNKMTMITEPKGKGLGEDTKNAMMPINWNKNKLGLSWAKLSSNWDLTLL